jgi:type IV protein arginine methyltransferase
MIIEPHRDVLAHMRAHGWYDRPGVKILEGRWQDFIQSGEIYGYGAWDVVYVDTFAEGYEGRCQSLVPVVDPTFY